MIPRDGAAVMGALMVPSSGCWGPEANQRSPVLHWEGQALLWPQAGSSGLWPELMGFSSKGQ